MPTANIPNIFFLSHVGLDIFHLFKNDDEDQGLRTYWYTTDAYGSENDETAFDVRSLSRKLRDGANESVSGLGKTGNLDTEHTDNHAKIIEAAIEFGLVR